MARALNEIMEFDHVIQVHEDGTVTDAPDLGYDTFEPTLTGDSATGLEELESHPMAKRPWALMTHGYTGQYGYSGPLMHDSESIGGQLEDDILAQPGLYVAVYCTWYGDASEDTEDAIEGWAVAFKEAS
jgi:hypothetical protein